MPGPPSPADPLCPWCHGNDYMDKVTPNTWTDPNGGFVRCNCSRPPQPPTIDELNSFRLEDYPGIAWHAIAYVPIHDEYGDEDGYTTDTIIAVMIGDNRRFHILTEDCIPITEDEYCSQCGQIGCGHG